MTAELKNYTPVFLGDDLENLINSLRKTEWPMPTTISYIGDQNYQTLDDLITEAKHHTPLNQRVVRRDSMLRVGILPLARNSLERKLICGVNYSDQDGFFRDSGEIKVSLENEILPYTENSIDKLNLVVVDQEQFNQLDRSLFDVSKRMTTTTRIPTALKNPTTRDLFYKMIEQAVANRVSDIHIEPLGNSTSRVRYRIDGSLIVADVNLTPESFKNLVQIIKVEAKFKIDESRRPQDGRINFEDVATRILHPELKGYSLRVSTAPLNYGEKVALRILKEEQSSGGLEKLGYPHDLYLKIKRMAESPHGLILVTGPTGSGKTTTLYSILNYLNKDDVNIITIEDPIESVIPGVNQSIVHNEIGWDFGHMLRTYLRQDPDIILVGEIRDQETARSAMEAAKTGHLVLSTVHTMDSTSTILRLYELGVENTDLQSSLNGIIAQRLVRKVCPSCSIQYNAAPELNALFETDNFSLGPPFCQGTGLISGETCNKCHGIGYFGRMVIPEVWELGDEERELIGESCKSVTKYSEIAMKHGLKPLAVAAMEAVIDGKTTLDEVTKNVVKSYDLFKRRGQLIDLLKKIPN